MSAVIIRPEEDGDREAILDVITRAFGQKSEAELVQRLHKANDVVLSLVAERDGEVRGHILFSRMYVKGERDRFPALALAPMAVHAEHQGEGIGKALIDDGHLRLQRMGETLSVVLGDPDYYGRFGYTHERAAHFESDYQCDALQALAWDTAPVEGRLDYPAAFGGL